MLLTLSSDLYFKRAYSIKSKVGSIDMGLSKEEEELYSLFKDESEEIKEKRTRTIKEVGQTSVDLPAHLSITTAFDELLQCFSIGGQIKQYYRYGSISSCEQQREKFWFAIRNGSFNDKDDKDITNLTETELNRRKKIQDFYKERLLKEKALGSSEDVWDVRQKPLERPFKDWE